MHPRLGTPALGITHKETTAIVLLETDGQLSDQRLKQQRSKTDCQQRAVEYTRFLLLVRHARTRAATLLES